MLSGQAAAAAAKKHVKHHASHSAAPSALEQKVEALTEAVSALQIRLNDSDQARQATQAQAQAAQTDAAAARSDAQAARSQLAEQIQTIPGEVKTEIAAETPKPKASWTDGTKLGATVFTDFSNISQTPGPNKINGTGADIKRAYVSVDHTFNDIYSANLTVDLAPNGIILNGGTYGTGTLQGSETIKYAYVQAKYADALVVQVGAEKTPWIPFVEDIYGYRYIDKVIVDQNKFGNSSDWGVNVHGDLGHGLFDYSLSVIDGDGYKTPERSELMDFEGRANVNWNGFVAAVGGYSGQEGSDIQTNPATAIQTATRFDGLLAYTNTKIRFGVEYFEATDWKVVTKPTPDQANGVSVFGSYNFTPMWSVFGRYDNLDPSEKLAPTERYTYFDLGLGYEPVKVLDLGVVFKHEEIRNAAPGGYADATTTLAAASTAAHPLSGNYNEIGLYTQLKF